MPVTSSGPDVLVTLESVSKTYRGAPLPALDRVSLDVPRGSFFGLLGPNGAGKTTLISIVCGLIAPDGGRIAHRGRDGQTIEARRARDSIGLVPQDLAFYPTLTVTENLAFFAALYDLDRATRRERIAQALAVGQLDAVRGEPAGHLSGGLKRRLNLAIGIVNAPDLLVLDEPTVGVDAQSRRFLQRELKRLNHAGTTILYTSHYLEEVEQLCDRLAVIDHGKVVAAGSTASLLAPDTVTLRLGGGANQEPLARTVEALTALPAVRAVRSDADRLLLFTDRREETLAAALELLRTRQVSVLEASIGARSLESLFFQLTGAQLRDPLQ